MGIQKKHGVEVMNSQLLKSARVSKGKSQRDMAKVIGKSFSGYEKKENGTTLFSVNRYGFLSAVKEVQ